jgi:riboflavin synthase
MFTGIIEEVGQVTRIEDASGRRRLTVGASRVPQELRKGDSIAVSGVCLTAVEITPRSFAADLAEETWKRTSFSRLREGALVNLEMPMRADGRFGGHIVQGHVDGTGKFVALEKIKGGDDYRLLVEVPRDLARYVISKGSLAIEGISLTVAQVQGTQVGAAIIPHTAEMTNLKSLRRRDLVNLEVDMMAKYVEKMLRGDARGSSIAIKRLVKAGF